MALGKMLLQSKYVDIRCSGAEVISCPSSILVTEVGSSQKAVCAINH